MAAGAWPQHTCRSAGSDLHCLPETEDAAAADPAPPGVAPGSAVLSATEHKCQVDCHGYPEIKVKAAHEHTFTGKSRAVHRSH